MRRRDFLRTTAIGAGMMAMNSQLNVFALPNYQLEKNKLPRWRGFNAVSYTHLDVYKRQQ